MFLLNFIFYITLELSMWGAVANLDTIWYDIYLHCLCNFSYWK